jgi:CheY-like chemotaxis protein
VVITDVIMPDQDGYSVCSQIKQNPDLGGIPVVLMSGVVNKSVADKAVAVKADELIRKPFQPQELIGRVKSLLAPKDVPAAASRERNGSSALQSLFAPPAPVAPAAQAVPMPPPVTAHDTPIETAWPRALAEAFTPLLQPFSSHAAQQPTNNGAQARPPLAPQAQPANSPSHQTPASSAEVAKLRGEIARVELLVRKLQSELQLEREYNVALEQQIRTLMAAN